MSRRTPEVTDAAWLSDARALSADLGLRNVRFLRGAAGTMPMAWGIVNPAVLMPADADEWPVERLRIVLLHELAHVSRRDCLTHLLAQAACAVYWFHPLAWMAARRARNERERACDDLVLAAGTRGSDYAEEGEANPTQILGCQQPAQQEHLTRDQERVQPTSLHPAAHFNVGFQSRNLSPGAAEDRSGHNLNEMDNPSHLVAIKQRQRAGGQYPVAHSSSRAVSTQGEGQSKGGG